jgi:hypothetical protein
MALWVSESRAGATGRRISIGEDAKQLWWKVARQRHVLLAKRLAARGRRLYVSARSSAGTLKTSNDRIHGICGEWPWGLMVLGDLLPAPEDRAMTRRLC